MWWCDTFPYQQRQETERIHLYPEFGPKIKGYGEMGNLDMMISVCTFHCAANGNG